MIQPAALPATAALSVGAALQNGQADESGIPGGFADLLASSLNGDTPPAAPSDKVPAEALIAGMVAARQMPGKVAGKTLPDALPEPLPDAEEAPIDEDAAAEITDIPAAPILPVPFSLAMLNAIVLPQPENAAPVAAETAAVTLAPAAETKTAPVEAKAETAQAKPDTALAAATLTVALPESQRIAQRLLPQPTETVAEATPPAETRATAVQPAAAAIVLQAAGNAIAPKVAGARTDERAKADAEAAAKSVSATTAPASTAETLRQRSAHAGEVAAATPRVSPVTAATSDVATADPLAQLGAELQPLIASRDAPASQATTINAGPAAPGALAERGHDFAALVDRLVEARDAASPQTVSAAIRHAEFGQVSLRFDQGDNGLSVAMTSADPDFARAVQAAGPAGQTATSDNGNNSNGGSQNSTGNASAQTQSQSQSSTRDGQTAQSREEAGRTPASRRANDGRADEGEQPGSTRDGIYA